LRRRGAIFGIVIVSDKRRREELEVTKKMMRGFGETKRNEKRGAERGEFSAACQTPMIFPVGRWRCDFDLGYLPLHYSLRF
jgi:hypothetical protein